ncbi:MAG: hypothetical protein NZL87_08710, partial [Thermomicrobium sp.]|nr:hypothetical protein [Thermomicrobium sp.]
FVVHALAALDTAPMEPLVVSSSRKEMTMTRIRPLATVLAATLALALVVWLAPVGALADQLVQRFRVQQFAAITIPAEAVQTLTAQLQAIPEEDRATLHERLEHALQVTPTDGTVVRNVTSLEEAATHLARTPLVPGTLPAPFAGLPPQYFVSDPQRRELTIDVARTQQALSDIGLRFASLPDPSVTPTVTVTFSIPASAAQVWQTDDGRALVVAELESPTLDLPAEIDPELLREDLLMLPGLPPDVVAQIRAVRDWRQTLIIPLPENATSRSVSLRGITGLLIEAPDGAAVLWQERGILHIVGGHLSADQVLAVARSLRS